jgi:hypothetical protein
VQLELLFRQDICLLELVIRVLGYLELGVMSRVVILSVVDTYMLLINTRAFCFKFLNQIVPLAFLDIVALAFVLVVIFVDLDDLLAE